MKSKGEIVIFTSADGVAHTEVHLEADTLWLSQKMMADLFEKDSDTIGLHLKNIYAEQELEESATTEFFSVVQTEGSRTVSRQVKFYNLDAILSVGYRVSSKRGTQFRIWANRVLKEHLTNGYTVNEKRLQEQTNKIRQLKETISVVERSLTNQVQNLDEARTIVQTLSNFAHGLAVLDDYDNERLEVKGRTERSAKIISEDEFMRVVEAMRRDFDSDIFGQPRDESFHSSVGQIYQAFGGSELYPSIENKAAILLYLVVKNHSFVDGNKRIGAALFLHFLERNDVLYGLTGAPIINNDALAVLTLLIAESKPDEMETMVKLITTILNRGQQ